MFNRLLPFVLLLGTVLACANTPRSNNSGTISPGRSAATPIARNEPSVTRNNWGYSETKDAMGRGAVYYTSIESSNTLSLDFPYQGEQHCRLALRQHPQYGTDVLVSIEKGQLLDSDYHSDVMVRFDEDKAKAFSSTSPADGSSETLFLGSGAFSFFLARLKTAKTLRIEMPVYQAGNQICEFDVEGFTWKNSSKP